MNRMKWLDNYKDIIICIYNEGMKQIEIANEFEVSQTAISNRLRKWNVSNTDGNRFIRYDITKEDLYRLYWTEEKHPSEIAEIYKCHKITVHNFLKKYDIPRRTKSEARQGKLNPIYGVGHTEETKQKMSDAFSNGVRTRFGFSDNWGSAHIYESPNQGLVKMRSSWEVKTADYLTDKGTDWYYEDIWIDLGYTKYLPDFYIPDLNVFIEVKGRTKVLGLEKVKNARKEGYTILLWDGEELLKRGIINNSGSTAINRKYKNKTTMHKQARSGRFNIVGFGNKT